MSNINTSIINHRNVTLSIGGQPYVVLVYSISLEALTDRIKNGTDKIYITPSYNAYNIPISVFAYHEYGTSEYISPLNIGETLTIDSGSDWSITRTANNTFSVHAPEGYTNTFSFGSSNATVYIRAIFECQNGDWIGGAVSMGLLATVPTYGHNIDTTEYFPKWIYDSVSISGTIEDRTDANILKNHIQPTDPYSGAGDSDTGGGGGTFDGSSDPVPVPSLPSVGATNTGFISLFVPTQAQLKQVADYLWSPFLDISTFKKIFENPMDCILGLSVVPVTIPTSGDAQITVGNVELSGITLPLASQQYVEVDCGSIPFTDKFFGSYLDHDPYTKMALFVPYSGVHSVKADDIMGKTVNLKYHIDILTGSLVAFLTCGDSVLYEFNGACASNIPVNSMNYASTIENAIRIAVNIGTTLATAGAAAPLTGANKAARETARTFGTAINMTGSTAEGILSLKPNIDRAGSLGGTTGLMGNQIPYFIITRPRLCKPANQNTFKGYPSFIQVTISDLIGEGYTEFDAVVLAGLYLTDGEKEELKQILESGVYL